MELTQEQKAKIYCIKHGHAKYVNLFMGYVYCGRCSDQIGDTYSSPFDFDDKALIGHKCNRCDKAEKKLNSMDKEILKRLNKDKNISPNYEKILEGIDFE